MIKTTICEQILGYKMLSLETKMSSLIFSTVYRLYNQVHNYNKQRWGLWGHSTEWALSEREFDWKDRADWERELMLRTWLPSPNRICPKSETLVSLLTLMLEKQLPLKECCIMLVLYLLLGVQIIKCRYRWGNNHNGFPLTRKKKRNHN